MIRILLVLTLILIGGTAEAQLACGQRDAILKTLDEKYGEEKQNYGLAQPGFVFEFYGSEVTGTWSIIRTDVNGVACVMAVGDNWNGIVPTDET